jgi:hypothetical protein
VIDSIVQSIRWDALLVTCGVLAVAVLGRMTVQKPIARWVEDQRTRSNAQAALVKVLELGGQVASGALVVDNSTQRNQGRNAQSELTALAPALKNWPQVQQSVRQLLLAAEAARSPGGQGSLEVATAYEACSKAVQVELGNRAG